VPSHTLGDLGRRLRHLPIRWRLTLMFAGVMALLLAALIGFIYFHFRSDLDYNINQSLRARAQEVASLVRDENAAGTRSALARLTTDGDNFVQVLDRSGRVLSSSAAVAQPALLSRTELERAMRSPRLFERGEQSRLYALPLPRAQQVVVAGVSLAERDAALDKLDQELFIGVPPALLLATLAAFVLASAALAPVERMRLRAATISTDEISKRLPLPDSDDEIHRLGETLNAMLDRLEAGLNHERLFVANASHELRMPLAVLKAELEVSLRERGGELGLRAAMASAVEETDRIIKLAEDLLLLARAADGTLPIEPQPLAVEELLLDLGSGFAPLVERAGRTLVVEPDSAPPGTALRGDPDRLHQAIANLVENSLCYGAGPIVLKARLRAGSIELHVSDRGAGFSQEWLAIVRTIAEAHGGSAHAGNLAGGGADIWLALPASVLSPPLIPDPAHT
jgi:two-component system OmpR family sensor kinase